MSDEQARRAAEAWATAAEPEPEQPEPDQPEQPEAEQPEQPGAEQPEPEPEQPEAAAPATPAGAADDEPDVEEPSAEQELAEEASHEALLEKDLNELAAKAEKADEYLELAQRTRADFENYRKRAAREAALAQERGVARLAKELLPAIDNLDRAVEAAAMASGATAADPGEDPAGDAETAADATQLVSGIKLVHADLLAALARAGIEPFSPVGEAFDPQWHEAVAQVPIEGGESGVVVEVYQLGYRLGETVLRPARVLVAA